MRFTFLRGIKPLLSRCQTTTLNPFYVLELRDEALKYHKY